MRNVLRVFFGALCVFVLVVTVVAVLFSRIGWRDSTWVASLTSGFPEGSPYGDSSAWKMWEDSGVLHIAFPRQGGVVEAVVFGRIHPAPPFDRYLEEYDFPIALCGEIGRYVEILRWVEPGTSFSVPLVKEDGQELGATIEISEAYRPQSYDAHCGKHVAVDIGELAFVGGPALGEDVGGWLFVEAEVVYSGGPGSGRGYVLFKFPKHMTLWDRLIGDIVIIRGSH